MGGKHSADVKRELAEKPVVVIVGGGYGGVAVAQELESKANVVLIDRKNYFLHNVAAMRASVSPAVWSERVAIPYTKALKYGTVVQGDVVKISDQHVHLHGLAQPIRFDYLVLATGTSYAFPCKIGNTSRSEVRGVYQGVHEKIRAARSVAVVGGGPVGCSLVAEIKEAFPEKPVTLVHSHEKLLDPCPQLGDKMKKTLHKRLVEMGVTVHLGERLQVDPADAKDNEKFIDYPSGAELLTDKGTRVVADLVFNAMGSKVNSSCYAEHLSGVMNSRGQIRVNRHMQVEGYSHIFAIGDCAASEGDMQMAAVAHNLHAPVAAANISALIKGKAVHKEHKPKHLMIVELGSKGGVGEILGFNVGDRISRLKAKDLLAPDYWKQLGKKEEFPKDASESRQVTVDGHPAEDEDIRVLSRKLEMDEGLVRDLVGARLSMRNLSNHDHC